MGTVPKSGARYTVIAMQAALAFYAQRGYLAEARKNYQLSAYS